MLLHPAEAAAHLGVSRATIDRHIAAGDISAIDSGLGIKRRRLRIEPSELERFKDARRWQLPSTKLPEPTATISGGTGYDFLVLRAQRQSRRQTNTKPR